MSENSRLNLLREGIEALHPAYFSLVMATGIVSTACLLLQLGSLAWILLYINVLAYTILWLLTLLRLVFYPRRMLSDLLTHALGPGYFTLIAGTCVLGTQFVVLAHAVRTAFFLWCLGVFLWVVIMYSFFTVIILRSNKPSLEKGINGAWLIATVATQSISVLGTLLAGQIPGNGPLILFFALVMYLLGCMLFLIITVLLFYRFTFFDLAANELTPPYWISMGAAAITTLAGSTLMLASSKWDFLVSVLPFLKGFTLFFWIMGTWWIPILIILGAWRHLYKRVPLIYHPLYWGLIFPLGMYTASTFQLAKALQLDFLFWIPRIFIYIALGAWAVCMLGLIYHLINRMIGVRKGGRAAGDPVSAVPTMRP